MKGIAIPAGWIDAACRLHGTLESWRVSDAALDELKKQMPGFSLSETLVKVSLVNSLYFTNERVLVGVAKHFAKVLVGEDLRHAGVELVEKLATVEPDAIYTRRATRTSLAAKFAHFFIDGERFPIYDSYARIMTAKHLGLARSSLEGKYPAFANAFDELALREGLFTDRRRLDRYLWIQGQFEAWNHDGLVNRELQHAFQAGKWPPRNSDLGS